MGADPDDSEWSQSVESLKELGYKKIHWFGLREHSLFDGHWSPEDSFTQFAKSLSEATGGAR